jgi:hypothetical protein
MPIKPTVHIDPDDMVRYLLYQQFYYGDDKIYNRTKDLYEYIPGAEKAIDNFYNLIIKPIKYLDTGQITEYLEYFHQFVYPIHIQKIKEKYNKNREILGKGMNQSVILTIIVGESLLELHQHCFDAAIANFIKSLIINIKDSDPRKKKEYKKKIQSKLRTLYTRGDPEVGMIYSLSFLQFLAEKVESSLVYQKTLELLEDYYLKLAKKF